MFSGTFYQEFRKAHPISWQFIIVSYFIKFIQCLFISSGYTGKNLGVKKPTFLMYSSVHNITHTSPKLSIIIDQHLPM